MLLEARADTELTNSQGQTALYIAVANGNEGCFLSCLLLFVYFPT
jgi:ankyrin repeat protein